MVNAGLLLFLFEFVSSLLASLLSSSSVMLASVLVAASTISIFLLLVLATPVLLEVGGWRPWGGGSSITLLVMVDCSVKFEVEEIFFLSWGCCDWGCFLMCPPPLVREDTVVTLMVPPSMVRLVSVSVSKSNDICLTNLGLTLRWLVVTIFVEDELVEEAAFVAASETVFAFFKVSSDVVDPPSLIKGR